MTPPTHLDFLSSSLHRKHKDFVISSKRSASRNLRIKLRFVVKSVPRSLDSLRSLGMTGLDVVFSTWNNQQLCHGSGSAGACPRPTNRITEQNAKLQFERLCVKMFACGG